MNGSFDWQLLPVLKNSSCTRGSQDFLHSNHRGYIPVDVVFNSFLNVPDKGQGRIFFVFFVVIVVNHAAINALPQRTPFQFDSMA